VSALERSGMGKGGRELSFIGRGGGADQRTSLDLFLERNGYFALTPPVTTIREVGGAFQWAD
jgi:hypothetical protein